VFSDHYFCFGCGENGDAIDWMMKVDRLSFQDAVAKLSADGTASRKFEPVRREAYTVDRYAAAAAQIWREALPPRGTPVEAYLRFRHLSLPPAPVLKYHPSCPRGRNERLPAMVALMTDPVTGQPVGIHRTFIRCDGQGKADLSPNKMMLGRSGVIRLVDDDDIGESLGLAEGIETALSLIQHLGWSAVWSACSAGGIRTFPPLPARNLTIFADGDPVGKDAALTCARRWDQAGTEVTIWLPPPDASDWLEVAVREGW
jgi:hypothetical protein